MSKVNSIRRAGVVLATGAVFGMLIASPVVAQSVLAYPTKGQSAEQVRKDETECQMWAMERTGFNPRQAPPQSYNQPYNAPQTTAGFGTGETGRGGVIGDGARGAALGAIGGAIAGDAGEGAAWGALGGAIFGGMKRNRRKSAEAQYQQQQQQNQHQQQQQYNQQLQSFNAAVGLCMESRDYRVQY